MEMILSRNVGCESEEIGMATQAGGGDRDAGAVSTSRGVIGRDWATSRMSASGLSLVKRLSRFAILYERACA